MYTKATFGTPQSVLIIEVSLFQRVLNRERLHCITIQTHDTMRKVSTVEPPIKDPQRRGHNKNNLSIKDTLHGPKCSFSHTVNTF